MQVCQNLLNYYESEGDSLLDSIKIKWVYLPNPSFISKMQQKVSF